MIQQSCEEELFFYVKYGEEMEFKVFKTKSGRKTGVLIKKMINSAFISMVTSHRPAI